MASILGVLSLLCSAAVVAAKDEAVVIVVDPVWDDIAGYAYHVPLLREYKIVQVKTRLGKARSYVKNVPPVDFFRKFAYDSLTPDYAGAAKQICPQLKEMGIPVAAVIPTSDGTVALTDELAACVGAQGNPATGPKALARRDKWVMGEAVRKAGLRAIHEKIVYNWEEAREYLQQTWDPPLSPQNPCVFKILQGSGGEGVQEVHSLEQGKKIFDVLEGSKEKFGGVNNKVLIQEYLQGKEYAVDSVSRDGVHKVIAVWFEDFRPANGIFDQYFGFKMMDPEDPKMKVIIDYHQKVLDALGKKVGAANTEIKWLDSEQTPCLVETNDRWAGISWNDGLATEQASVGLDQVTAAFTAFLDKDGFDRMPMVRPLLEAGAVFYSVNYEGGILRSIPGMDVAKQCPAYVAGHVDTEIGAYLPPTNPQRIPVSLALASKDPAEVDACYEKLQALVARKAFFDTVPEASSFLSAHHTAESGSSMIAIAALMGLIAGAVFATILSSMSRRSGRDNEGTGYLAIE